MIPLDGKSLYRNQNVWNLLDHCSPINKTPARYVNKVSAFQSYCFIYSSVFSIHIYCFQKEEPLTAPFRLREKGASSSLPLTCFDVSSPLAKYTCISDAQTCLWLMQCRKRRGKSMNATKKKHMTVVSRYIIKLHMAVFGILASNVTRLPSLIITGSITLLRPTMC